MRSDGEVDPSGTSGSAAIRDDDGGRGKQGLNLRALAFVVAGIVVVADQLAKWWALHALANGPIVVIDGFFQFRLTFNSGASFSMLTQAGPVIAVIAFGVIGLILFVLGDASHRIEAISLGLVLGGAVGNLADRLFRGEGLFNGRVIDFIDFSFFATFNLADTAITIGVILLLGATFLRRT